MCCTKWIDKNNVEQCEWAFNYLLNKRYGSIFNTSADIENLFNEGLQTKKFYYEIVIEILNVIPNSLEKKELIRLMKQAWRGVKNKLKNKDKKKQCSYMLDTSAIKALKKLAKIKDLATNKTLELLINRGFDFEEEAKTEAKNERDKQKSAKDKKSSNVRKTKESKELNALNIKLATIKNSFNNLKNKYEAQLRTVIEQTIKLQDAELFDKKLTKDQKKRVDAKLQQKLQKLQNDPVLKSVSTMNSGITLANNFKHF